MSVGDPLGFEATWESAVPTIEELIETGAALSVDLPHLNERGLFCAMALVYEGCEAPELADAEPHWAAMSAPASVDNVVQLMWAAS